MTWYGPSDDVTDYYNRQALERQKAANWQRFHGSRRSPWDRATDLVRKGYDTAADLAPDTGAFRPYTGPLYTADRYRGPVGDDWVERFKPTNKFGGISDSYVDLIEGELARGPYDTEERRANEARRASVSASQEFDLAQAARDRELMSLGINPASGAFRGSSARAGLARALMTTGAANTARESVRQAGIADRDRRLQIGAMGQEAMERQRAFDLDAYRAEQEQRQFGANMAMSAWNTYQQQRAADADRGLDEWTTRMQIISGDRDREQAERRAILEDLGAIYGDMVGGGGRSFGGGSSVSVRGPSSPSRRRTPSVGTGSGTSSSRQRRETRAPKLPPGFDPYQVWTSPPPNRGGGGGMGSSRAPTYAPVTSPRPQTRPPVQGPNLPSGWKRPPAAPPKYSPGPA